MPDKRRITLWKSTDGESRVLYHPAGETLTFTTAGQFTVHVSVGATLQPAIESAADLTKETA